MQVRADASGSIVLESKHSDKDSLVIPADSVNMQSLGVVLQEMAAGE